MTYTRNVKKVTQVTYVQNVMMLIELNIDLFTFYPSSATANHNPSSSTTANQHARQDRLLTIFV